MLKRTLKKRAKKIHSLAMLICLELGNCKDMSEYNCGDECYRGEFHDGFISIEFSNEIYSDSYCNISSSSGTVYASHLNALLLYQPGEWEKHLERIGRIAKAKRRNYLRTVVGESGYTVKGRPYYACTSPEIYL